MTDSNLTAKTRAITGKSVKNLRKQGEIPAVLYGHKITSQNLAVDYHKFEAVLQQAGESTLVDLKIDDQSPVKVLIKDIQYDPISNNLVHIDFHQVRMDEELETEVELKFIGEAPAVKELSGILVTTIDKLNIKCLPKYLVHEIEVDLSKLKTFEDLIHVSDIKVPEGIEVSNPADEVVVLVQEPRSEKEFETLAAAPTEAAPAEKVGEKEGETEAKAEETTK